MSDFTTKVAEVKLAYNIVDYISTAGVSLKLQGGKWKGLCVFHNEKTPSFIVDERFQSYRCFGCGANGDIISFVQNYEHLEFYDALQKLAADKNIVLNIDNTDSTVDYHSLRACLRETANFFHKNFKKLPATHRAISEIRDHGLAPEDFVYGYAPEGRHVLYTHLKEKGFTNNVILDAGVCKKSDKNNNLFDFWQGRLIFYLTDVSGKPVGFSGKKLFETDQMGKYVNSSDGPLFNKSNVLFNFSKAKDKAAKDKIIYVTEGQFDVVAMVNSGLDNTVASSGTAFTERQGSMCQRLVTDSGKIVFCFDGDQAGLDAAIKVFNNIPSIQANSYFVKFPKGFDPADFRKEYGAVKLVEYVESKQRPLVEFVLAQSVKGFNIDDAIERSKYVKSVSKVLAAISDKTLKEFYSKKAALKSNTPLDVIEAEVKSARVSSPQKENIPIVTTNPIMEEADVDEGPVIDLIDNDNVFNAAARLIHLGFSYENIFNRMMVQEVYSVIPRELRFLLKTLRKKNFAFTDSAIVAEMFNHTAIANHVINSEFFHFSGIMTEDDLNSQFDFLLSYMISKQEDYKQSNKMGDLSRMIDSADANDVDFFKAALINQK